MEVIAAIDNGTTSSRVILFNKKQEIVAQEQQEYQSIYPQPGWCEQDPMQILNSVTDCMARIASRNNGKFLIKAIGLTNQRETLCCWDKSTGEPLCNALVWLDTRTKEIVNDLIKKAGGNKEAFTEICGLPITTYFSAVKLVQKAASEDRLLVGTVDSWLIYKLTGGKAHVTDVTNASRTMLMDLQNCQWSDKMLKFFDIQKSFLPDIKSSSEVYGYCSVNEWNGIPIAGCLGDQQSALVGQQCFKPGQAKNTYGTGCFMLLNAGCNQVPPISKSGLLTTVAFKLGKDVYYAYEGSIAISGAAVKWMRDQMQLIQDAEELSELASKVKDCGGVTFIPAFTGLFAPHWKTSVRGCIYGLTQYSSRNHICRALLEAVSFQTREILQAMKQDGNIELKVLKVDGGMSNSDPLMQIQSDVLGIKVLRPQMRETTALGAALAAGLAINFWKFEDLQSQDDNFMQQFSPQWSEQGKLTTREMKNFINGKALSKSLSRCLKMKAIEIIDKRVFTLLLVPVVLSLLPLSPSAQQLKMFNFSGSTTNTQNQGNNLFGNQNQAFSSQQNPAGTFGTSFGQSQPQQSSLFGGQQSTLQGGQQQQSGQQTSLFGGQQSLFGQQPAGGLFSQSTVGQQQQPQQSTFGQSVLQQQPSQAISAEQVESDKILKQFDEIQAAYDLNDVRCQFRHAFYNVVQPQDVSRYVKPNNISEGQWKDALSAAPNQKNMVPVFAQSFEDLQKRLDMQKKQIQQYKAKITEINRDLQNLSDTQNIKVSSKIIQVKENHLKLSQKILKTLKLLQILRSKGNNSLSGAEEHLKRVFEESLGKVYSKDIAGKLEQIRSKINMMKNIPEFQDFYKNNLSSFEITDEESAESILSVLSEMQMCLEHVTKVINQDSQVLENVANQLKHKQIKKIL